jgi:uncharacterized repeat protein (TIGR01451 family)
VLLERILNVAIAARSWKGECRALLYAAFAMLLLFSGPMVRANQTPSSSAGTGPVTKTFPGGTTMQIAEVGTNTAFFAASAALNSTGGITAAQLSPAISVTTNASDMDISAVGCSVAVARCANRGTLTLTFSHAVTNPVIHISGIGGNSGTAFYHTSLLMSSSDAAALPTFTKVGGNAALTVTAGEIRSTTINGGTSCTAATAAGCGSVRINGTFTTVTMQVDLLMAGSGSPTGTDGWTITASIDEDFGDAPGSYDPTAAASHIVGGYFMGTAPTVENAATTNILATPVTPSPIANATASTDGSDNGVTFPTLTRGVASTIAVAVTGSGGRLQGWIDWADDGNFTTAGDRIATDATDGGVLDTDGLVNGVIRLAVTPPAGTTQVTTISRFRWSPTAGVGPTTRGTVGEVEDYEVIVYPQRNDLSLTKTVSNPSPAPGSAVSYTLTVNSAVFNATTSNATATGITVQDTLPAGFTYTGVAAGGTGTYNNLTGVWSVGSLAPGATASITINGTASNTPGTTVTNIAQISASSVTDSDSTPNNGVTSEDDYATVAFTTSAIFNCPTGSTATGSGYATGGTGQYQNQIFWLDWSCGGTTTFPIGSIINKSWNAGDGLVITAQVNNITGGDLSTYSTGGWTGDLLDDMYPGVNPVGLGGAGGVDPSFGTTYTATLNGSPVSLRYVMADAESTDAGAETMSGTTTGSPWQLVEKQGGIVETLAGTSASWTGGGGSSSLVLETSGTTVQLNNSIVNNGGQFFAFGVFTPFDYSDAPTTATSYGAANHRTVSSLRMGAAFTNEAAAYDSPTASADVDDAVTLPNLFRSQAASINVPVFGSGYLSAWADWNDDGDFADVGEKYASDAVDGGAGDADATVNGVIVLSVTPPATAATTATIGRFRYASITGAPISGLHGFGEVEDYPLTVIQPRLDVTKTSYIVTDYVSASNPKSIPGALVRYCILVTNSGSAPATGVDINDVLPGDVTYVPGSMLSASGCSTTATAEDDNSADGDEADPFGMSISGTTVTGTAATLGVGDSFALIFNAVVD